MNAISVAFAPVRTKFSTCGTIAVIAVRLAGRLSPAPSVNGTELMDTVPTVMPRRRPPSQYRSRRSPVMIPWLAAIVRVPTVLLVRVVSWPTLAAARSATLTLTAASPS